MIFNRVHQLFIHQRKNDVKFAEYCFWHFEMNQQVLNAKMQKIVNAQLRSLI